MKENYIAFCTKEELRYVVRGLSMLADCLAEDGYGNESSIASSYAISLLARWNPDTASVELGGLQPVMIRQGLDELVAAAEATSKFQFGRKKKIQEARNMRETLARRWNL